MPFIEVKRYILRSYALLAVVFCLWQPDEAAANSVAVALDDAATEYTIHIKVPRPTAASVKTPHGIFARLALPEGFRTHLVGLPELPTLRYLLALPTDAIPVVELRNVRSEVLVLADLGVDAPLYPAQPSRSKTPRPGDDKFYWQQKAYAVDALWSPSVVPTLEKSGSLRGVGVMALTVYPVQYNPAQGTVKVITEMDVVVTRKPSQKSASLSLAEETPMNDSPYFTRALGSLVNWQTLTSSFSAKADQVRYPVTLLLIANDGLKNSTALTDLIQWKREKGFRVIEHYVEATTTPESIDTWIENTYAATTPRPSFVLLVGDESGPYTVATENPPSWDLSGEVSRSDLRYSVIGTVATDNHIPSLYCGRLSVRAEVDLEAQVAKILWYERDQFRAASPDLAYLKRPLGAAGADPTFGTTHGNPQIAYGWTYYLNATNGMPDALHFLHPDAATRDEEIRSLFSGGVNFYNYTAHGFQMGLADPEFSTSHVASLSNTGRYPLVLANCCLTGSFGEDKCFAEALLTAPNKGAIGYIGAAVNTLWDEDLAMGVGTAAAVRQVPPELSVDEPGVFDAIFSGAYTTQGGAMFAGLLAVERNGSALGRYWAGYHLFGDPSLSIFWGEPPVMSVSLPTALVPGPQSLQVTAPAGSLVAIHSDALSMASSALVNAEGSAYLDISPAETGQATVTITHPSYQPLQATITIMAPDRPWLSIQPLDVYIETAPATDPTDRFLSAANVGIGSIAYTATSDVAWLTLTPASGIVSGSATNHNLQVTSRDLAPGHYTGTVTFASADATNTPMSSTVRLWVRPPQLAVESPTSISVSAELGVRPPTTEIALRNTGLGMLTYTATSSVPWVTIHPASGSSTGETDRLTVSFNTDALPQGIHTGSLLIDAGDADLSPRNIPVEVTVLPPFSSAIECELLPLSADPSHPWLADISVSHDGIDSGRSATIADNQTSYVKLDLTGPGHLSFWWRVSSESGYDKLKCDLPGSFTDEISGDSGWRAVTVPVPSGEHTVTWSYDKDVTISSLMDCGWIDEVSYSYTVAVSATGASGVTSNSADLVGLFSCPNMEVTVDVYWSTNNNPDASAWRADVDAQSMEIGTYSNVTGQSVTGSVSSLIPNVTYYYTMAATNAATNIWASPNISFTPFAAVPPAINNDAGATPGLERADMYWNLTSDGGTSTSVTVYWGTADRTNDTGNWDYFIPLGVTAEGSDSVSTTNSLPTLLPGEDYFYRVSASNSAGVGWSGTEGFQVTNIVPTADAGSNQTVYSHEQVTLDGSGSSDSDSYPSGMTYEWSPVTGPAVTVTGTNTVNPTFTPTVAGSYVFQLEVSDGEDTDVDAVTVTVLLANTIPYADSFESYAEGFQLAGTNGWAAPSADAAVVATNNYTNSYAGELPISGNHELVLDVNGTVTTSLSDTENQTNVWVDVMVRFTHWEGDMPAEATDEASFAVVVDTNGNLRILNDVGTSNAWTKAPDTSIASGEWVRVTLHNDYTPGNERFRLWLNGIAVTNPSTWYDSANSITKFTSFVTHGRAQIDDLVVTYADPLPPVAPTDLDNDGIADDWEIANFGSIVVTDGSGDQDNDGFVDLYEYIAGTQPTNRSSCLRIDGAAVVNAGSYELTWPGVSGKTYDVLYKTNLSDSVWLTNATDVAGSEPLTVITNSVAGPSAFFILRVK